MDKPFWRPPLRALFCNVCLAFFFGAVLASFSGSPAVICYVLRFTNYVMRENLLLTGNLDPHTAGCPRNDAKRGFLGIGIEVLHFEFNDLENLFASHFADF